MWEKRNSVTEANQVELLKQTNSFMKEKVTKKHGGGIIKGTIFPRCFCTHSRTKHWATRIQSMTVGGKTFHDFIYAGCKALECECQEFEGVEKT